MSLALALLVALSLSFALLCWISQIRALARPPRRPPIDAPPISILKPLKGADPGLEANLRSFFAQDYPRFELLFGVEDGLDPAVDIVERLIAEHPDVTARLVVSRRRVGLNPKVNNLANMDRVAWHEMLLISDSNVIVEPGYVSDMVARACEPGVGLVTSLIRARSASGLGAALESLQLHTFVMGGVAAWCGLIGEPCVVGKSMMLRRSDLARIGGFEFLGGYLAEDQVCGEEIDALGLRVVVSGRPVDNVLGEVSLSGFAARHLRWARIRRRLGVAPYIGEALLNPVALAIVAAAAGAGLTVPALALTAMSLMAWSAERRLGVERNALLVAPLELARSLSVAVLWPVAFVSGSVNWRGNVLRIGERTRLLPREAPSLQAETSHALEAH